MSDSSGIEKIWEDDIREVIPLDSSATGINFISGPDYTKTRSNINRICEGLKLDYASIPDSVHRSVFLDSAMNVFSNCLLDSIIPYWYGTEWEFEGHTSTPGSGAIACGYFISTTLRDMGLKLNRYKFAQQDPEDETGSLAIYPENVMTTFLQSDEDHLKILQSLNDGLYMVGLENHVGYLLIRNGQKVFIHSNYIDGFVNAENACSSQAFRSYAYYLTKITGNRELGKKWLNNMELEIKTK